MSITLATKQSNSLALAMSPEELTSVLRNSLYPGAKDESIKLVIDYCRASGLDVMQKPVHIVPMSVATGRKDSNGWDIKEMRDVIMPGIGLYRTQAARSGEYAGVTEPEFGDDITETLGKTQTTYPKWCKVTVKRLMANGAIVEFTAKELWKENYATKSNQVDDPNAMWKKRPYAQLAKCTEAQALRKAFPEFGSQPTADEMEGKEVDVTQQGETFPPVKEFVLDADFNAGKAKFKSAIDAKKHTIETLTIWIEAKGKSLTEAQKAEINSWVFPIKEAEVIENPAQDNDAFLSDLIAAENEDN